MAMMVATLSLPVTAVTHAAPARYISRADWRTAAHEVHTCINSHHMSQ
jgi:hypothetical protein